MRMLLSVPRHGSSACLVCRRAACAPPRLHAFTDVLHTSSIAMRGYVDASSAAPAGTRFRAIQSAAALTAVY